MDGAVFGRYRLVGLLGRGGMGEVWRAHDTDTDRIVALKLLSPSVSADVGFQRRFRREAHAAARVSNPHVIPIHHYGEIEGRLYVDMRLIEGRDLAAVLGDGPLDPDRAVRVVEQIARALHAAHALGLLHRDVKPSNILLDADDFAYLIDFGIAHTVGDTRMTATGNAIGSFAYIAPERLIADSVEDARTDVYSLACVLYEALTGQPPFPGDSMAQLVTAHLHAHPPRVSCSRPGVPPRIDDVIAAGMAKDPDHRYASTIELSDAARRAITDPRGAAPSDWASSATQLAPSRAPTPDVGDAYSYPPQPPSAGEATAGLDGSPARHPALLQPSSAVATAARRRRRTRTIAVAVAVVIGAVGIGSAVVLTRGGRGSSVSGASASATPPASSSPPPSATTGSSSPVSPPVRSSLDGLLLGVDQVNAVMGTTGMVSLGILTAMADISPLMSDQACLPLAAVLQAKVYAGSGFTAEQGQIVSQDPQNVVDQAVVLFPSAGQARTFFDASTQNWRTCTNRSFTVTNNGASEVQDVGAVTDTDGILTATATPQGDPSAACQRALTAASNVIVDVTACTAPPGAAATIARQIAAKTQ